MTFLLYFLILVRPQLVIFVLHMVPLWVTKCFHLVCTGCLEGPRWLHSHLVPWRGQMGGWAQLELSARPLTHGLSSMLIVVFFLMI